MREGDRWATKLGFILAAAGSAIGLGNIWRFPGEAYENGGGAFLIPYLVALVTAGIPILIMEYGLGHRSQKAAPGTFRAMSRRSEWIGWWQIAVAFLVMGYYAVILAWAMSYVYYSIGTRWGDDPEGFFFGDYLGASDEFWQVGGVQWKVLIALVLSWAIIYAILRRGVPKGIELAAKVMIPALIVFMLVLVVRGITLPGADVGLNALFSPDFSALKDPGVWVAAYGQVFFSLSIAFSIMIVYASYLRKRAELPNTAVIVGLGNAGFELLAAIAVFSAIGFFASAQGIGVGDTEYQGITLAFVAFPAIINQLPALNSLFGVAFFGALVLAGITSAVSILECGIAGLRQKFALTRTAAVNWLCGLCALVSLLYVTGGGIRYLDVADHFVNNYGLVLAGLFEVVFVAWVARQLRPLQDHLNADGYLRVGTWWVALLAVVTPVLLGVMSVFNLVEEFGEAYEGYPVSGLVIVGGGAVLVIVLCTAALAWVRRGEPRVEDAEKVRSE